MERHEWRERLARESGLGVDGVAPFGFHDVVRCAEYHPSVEVRDFYYGVRFAQQSGRFSGLLERYLDGLSSDELVDLLAEVVSGYDRQRHAHGVVCFFWEHVQPRAQAAFAR